MTKSFTQRFSAIYVASALALASFALMSSGCATNKAKDEAQLHARIGTGLLQQARYPEALRELLVAEKLDPKSPTIQNNLGLAFFMRERYQTAADKLRNALQLAPNYTEARNNLARVLIELEQYDQAIRELKIVLGDLTYTDPAKAYVNLGLAQFRKTDYEEARVTFSKALKVNRENCLAQTYYGRSLFELAQFQAASNALDNASVICREGGADEPKYFSGLAYYKLGKTSSAISRMEDVIKLSPDGRYAKKADELLRLMR
ncbi:MAG: tetratricopeptide repeat protein [Proteobacteria bacterium]|nr:MAG: tetratricopeptide repeat protein [Pseudomonadota bacterium]